MSEDVATTAKAAENEKPEGTGESSSTIPDWVKDPEQAYAAIMKLQGKSQERLGKLSEFEQELEALKLQQKKAEEAKLAENQQWKELAAQREKEINDLKTIVEREKSESRQTRLENAIIAAAGKAEFIDPSEAAALIDRSVIKFDNDTFVGVDEAIAALAKAKPHLVKGRQNRATTVSNPAGTSDPNNIESWHPKFQRFGIMNPAFGDGGVGDDHLKE